MNTKEFIICGEIIIIIGMLFYLKGGNKVRIFKSKVIEHSMYKGQTTYQYQRSLLSIIRNLFWRYFA